MNNLSKFIQSLRFDYAVSYSGLRGENFINLHKEISEKIDMLLKEREISRFMEKSKLNRQITALEDEINIYKSRIFTIESGLHKSTVQIHKFQMKDKDISVIFDILKAEFIEQAVWMCPPVFRDAIVFYSNDDKVSEILHICFDCCQIINQNGELFDVDNRVFPLLKAKLMQLGHQIEGN